MRLDFLDEFNDPYLCTDEGRGVFLASVVLGMVARGQAGRRKAVDSSPMFKQLNFGKVQRRDIRRHMARLPELVRVYNLDYADMIDSLAAKAGDLMMSGSGAEPGIDGNFVFSVGFLNAPDYFFGIFRKKDFGQEEPDNTVTGEEEDV